MKKLKIFAFGTILFGLLSIIVPTIVEALSYQTLTQVPIADTYYTRRGGGQSYITAQYNTYTMNGKVVYCIEPGVNIDTHNYVGEDGFILIEAPYSPATNKKIELIGHYGYDYPGHQTMRYRMAAQSLIWEETGGQIVEFWTEMGGFGDYINLDYERNQIMNLVNHHYDKPTFHNSNHNVVIGQEFTVTDTSGILSQYEIYSADGLDVRIVGNTLYIKALKTGDLQLNLTRKHYDSATTMVFKGADARSQNMGYFRFSDPVTAFINIHSVGGRISINKLDNDSNSKTTPGESVLSGAIYGVYDSNRNLVDTLTVDSSGNAISKYLELGIYYIKEISPSTGYLVDPTEYTVTITEENLNITVTSKEQVIKRDIEIMKSYSLNGTGILTPEPNITFEIYNRYNTLVKTIVTDSQGYAKISDLPYGLYKVHQVNAPEGVNKVKDFNFSVEKDSPKIIKFNIVNDMIETYLRLIKKDIETGKTIPMAGIKFKIFDIDNNKYVSMKMTYPTAQIIDVFETDSNGVFITPEMLSVGHYRIEEINQVINGYLWNQTPLEFYVNGEGMFYNEAFGYILQLDFYNTQVKGSINIQKTGEDLIIKDGTYTYKYKDLAGVKFGLYATEDIIINGYKYYSKDELVGTYTTNQNGKISIANLPLGKYHLIELETLDNYVLDKNIYEIELSYIDQYTPIVEYNLNLENILKKGTLEFTKTDLNDGKTIPNTVIEIYTEDGDLVFTGITDENGKIIINNLFIGKFYIVEKEPATGYKINDVIVYFEITEDGEIVKSNMTNEKIKGTLELSKIDLVTGEAIPNTEIEIYNESDELVFSGITDENGLITIELEYGRYYILERNPATGYLLTSEKIYFDILEDGSIIKVVMTNEKIPVPNTGIDIVDISYILGAIALLGGIGVLIYENKRKKK